MTISRRKPRLYLLVQELTIVYLDAETGIELGGAKKTKCCSKIETKDGIKTTFDGSKIVYIA